jgi:hypothetical protein
MKTRTPVVVALMALVGIGLYAIGSGISLGQERDKVPARPKWEYKVLAVGGGVTRGVIDEKKLTALGEDGWELRMVSDGHPYVLSTSTSKITIIGKPDSTITTNTIAYTPTVYYFKRPK